MLQQKKAFSLEKETQQKKVLKVQRNVRTYFPFLFFKKNEILDSVYFSYYRALKRKRKELQRLGLFEQETQRLNNMGKEKKLPDREQYKEELIDIIRKKSKK